MRKTIFIHVLAIVILASVHLAEAQQAGKVPRIGYLTSGSAVPNYLMEGLRELGYVEGKNIVIEPRFAQRKLDRFPGLAAELVGLKVMPSLSQVFRVPWLLKRPPEESLSSLRSLKIP